MTSPSTIEELKTLTCVTESESNFGGISSLLKRMSERTSESPTKLSLKTASKNLGKRPRADEDTQRDAADKAQSKLEAQREYSRKSAARCRKRQKDRVAAFEDKCKEVSDETEEYQRINDILHAQVSMLVDETLPLLHAQVSMFGNRTLPLLTERHQVPPANPPLAPLLPTAQISPAVLEGMSVEQLLQMLH
jgi:hypothetical protein